MPSSLPFTLTDLKSAYADGMTPEDVIEEVYERLDRIADPHIFIHLCDKG